MAINIKPTINELPSAPVLRQAESELAQIEEQNRDAHQRIQALRGEQMNLLPEQEALASRRADIEQAEASDTKALEQMEVEVRHAASSPILAASKQKQLKDMRKTTNASSISRQKGLAALAERSSSITARLEAIQAQIDQEQATLQSLGHQEQLVRTSRDNARTALGAELYASHSARLDALQAEVDVAATLLVNARIALLEGKETAYTAMAPYPDIVKQAIRTYDLVEDETIHALRGFIAWVDCLEANAPKMVSHVGMYRVVPELALNEREVETLLFRFSDGQKTLQSKRAAVSQLLDQYQRTK